MHHRFIAPRPFSGNRLNIGIYTDACARSPRETDVTDWESGVCIGGDSNHKRKGREIASM